MRKPDSPIASKFVQAPASNHGRVRKPEEVTLFVVHSAECRETSTAAESLAKYLANGAGGRQASWHYSQDVGQTIQSLDELVTGWAVPGFNAWAIHVEMAGFSAQKPADWSDPFSETMIRTQTIPLILDVLKRRPAIKPVWLNAADLVAAVRAGKRPSGVTSHAECTKAAQVLKVRNNGHHDPGKGFPYNRIKTALAGVRAR